MYKIILRFLSFISLFMLICGQVCENWIRIPEANYNQTYVRINNPTANEVRPLGFKVAMYRFGGTEPCVLVTDTAGDGRHIEVRWELELPGRLCVRDSATGTPKCGNDAMFKNCDTVSGVESNINYSFGCTGNSCEGGDKKFWYRFVVEEAVDGAYDEYWCENRKDDFPSNFKPLPASQPAPTTTKSTSGTTSQRGFSYLIIFILTFLASLLIPRIN